MGRHELVVKSGSRLPRSDAEASGTAELNRLDRQNRSQ